MSLYGSEARRLEAAATEFGAQFDSAQITKLLSLLDLVYARNGSAGLTTVPRQDALRLHVIDSLSILPAIVEMSTIADFGSGGGFPGLVLAIMRLDLKIFLVEKRRRKMFLSS